MADVFDYLYWRGDLDIKSSPFNPVDAMILARLSYLPLDRVPGITGGDGVTIGEACRFVLDIPDIENKVLIKGDTQLATLLCNSVRFAGMTLSDFVNTVDAGAQTQFCAVTVKIDEVRRYISFRGTDNTLIGWKEDFNMTFAFPVHAQKLAAAYFEKISSKCKDCRLLVGGHSKGGNLALYASSFCSEAGQSQIDAVYNFDGPGFADEGLQSKGYKRICSRVNTYVPQSSVVGMMLGHEEKYTIVHSEQTGMLQHDIYSWNVLPTGFCDLQTVDDTSRFVDYTLKAWVSSLEPSQREAFFDTVYTILLETNATTLHEMSEKWFSSAKTVIKSFGSLDEGTRRAVTNGLSTLFRCAKFGYTQLKQARQQEEKNETNV